MLVAPGIHQGDHRNIDLPQFLQVDFVTLTLVLELLAESFHFQHRKPYFPDLLLVPLFKHAQDNLSFRQVVPEVIAEQCGQGRGAATEILGLRNDVGHAHFPVALDLLDIEAHAIGGKVDHGRRRREHC